MLRTVLPRVGPPNLLFCLTGMYLVVLRSLLFQLHPWASIDIIYLFLPCPGDVGKVFLLCASEEA